MHITHLWENLQLAVFGAAEVNKHRAEYPVYSKCQRSECRFWPLLNVITAVHLIPTAILLVFSLRTDSIEMFAWFRSSDHTKHYSGVNTQRGSSAKCDAHTDTSTQETRAKLPTLTNGQRVRVPFLFVSINIHLSCWTKKVQKAWPPWAVFGTASLIECVMCCTAQQLPDLWWDKRWQHFTFSP